jgi:prolyl-tRNA synthetase
VFKLGTKYSQALGATFQDQHGQQVPMVMGCYGIGVNRIVAAVIEQRHDGDGIVWPPTISPFQVLVSVLSAPAPQTSQLGDEVLAKLSQAGLEVLLDDREQSPGSKLKDADLIGCPVQVVIGKAWETDRQLEVVERPSKARHRVEPARLVETAKTLLDKLAPR